MYLDGYTPYEILQATSRKMYNDHLARKEEADSIIIPTINFNTTVKSAEFSVVCLREYHWFLSDSGRW